MFETIHKSLNTNYVGWSNTHTSIRSSKSNGVQADLDGNAVADDVDDALPSMHKWGISSNISKYFVGSIGMSSIAHWKLSINLSVLESAMRSTMFPTLHAHPYTSCTYQCCRSPGNLYRNPERRLLHSPQLISLCCLVRNKSNTFWHDVDLATFGACAVLARFLVISTVEMLRFLKMT